MAAVIGMRCDMNAECDNCDTRFCHATMACPDCAGTGFFIGAGIGGGELNYYGLQHPGRLICPVCDGKKVVTIYCTNY